MPPAAAPGGAAILCKVYTIGERRVVTVTSSEGAAGPEGSLVQLLMRHPLGDEQPLVYTTTPAQAYGGDQLRDAATGLAETIEATGVRPGGVVANLVGDGANPLVVMYAAWLAGAVYMPVNARLTDSELDAVLTDTPPAVVVGPGGRLDGLAVRAGRILETGDLSWSPTAHPAERRGPEQPYDQDVAFVMRTSGTTGRAKAVLLRHSGTLAGLDAILARIRSNPAATTATADGPSSPKPVAPPTSRPVAVNLIPVSLALWAGIYNTLFAFRAGAPVAVLDRFTTTGFVETVRRFDIRSSVLAPAMITMLNDDPAIDNLKPLRFVRSITAPLRREQAERFYTRFGIPVLNSYGQTELGGEVVGWTAADVREFGAAKLGSVGRPHPGVDLQIRAAGNTVFGRDEPGHIWVRSPFLMRGYAATTTSDPDADGDRDEEADGERLDAAGYLRTGDLGRVDADGFLWVEGRESDMINRGGLKISPDEVEQALLAHPGVADACVAAIADPRLGEVPYAWIVPAGPFDPDTLMTWCRQRLAPYKIPVGFTAVRELPRSEIGKVLRRALVDDLPG